MKTKISVAQYLAKQIALSGKSQKEIATLAGYVKPQIISMMKHGEVKLPLAKIGAIASALEIDPAYLMRLALSEYYPETWTAIEQCIGKDMVTDYEYEIIKAFREYVNESDPSVQHYVQQDDMRKIFQAILGTSTEPHII